jgi:hypothetical protein
VRKEVEEKAQFGIAFRTHPVWTDQADITVSNTSVTFTDPILQAQRFYRVLVVN